MQRYKIRCNDCDPKITPHENGKWVRWGDVERLRAELAECRNATAEDALRYAFIRAKHAADDDCWYVCGVGEADGDILDAKIDEARKGEGE